MNNTWSVLLCSIVALGTCLWSGGCRDARQAKTDPDTAAAKQAKRIGEHSADQPASKQPADDRRLWRYAPQHGGGYLVVMADGRWMEFAGADQPGAPKGVWEETARTPEYVELYDAKRNYRQRLGAGKAWLSEGRDGVYNPSPHGNWERPGDAHRAEPPAQPAEKPPDDSRRFWRYNPGAGGGYFMLLPSGKWKEFAGTDEPGAVRGVWEEIGRTPEYVELFDPKRDYKTWLGVGKAWLAHGKAGEYGPSPHGDWERPGGGLAFQAAPAGKAAAGRREPPKAVNGETPDYAKMKADWYAAANAPKRSAEAKRQAIRDELSNTQEKLANARKEARPAVEAKLRAANEELSKAQEAAKSGNQTPEQKLDLATRAGKVKRLERELEDPPTEETTALKGKANELIRAEAAATKAVREAEGVQPKEYDNSHEPTMRVGLFGKFGAGTYGVLHQPILQIIDRQNVILSNRRGEGLWWVEAPTNGLVDGQLYPMVGFYHCTGTRTYTTVTGGTKTVFVLKYVE